MAYINFEEERPQGIEVPGYLGESQPSGGSMPSIPAPHDPTANPYLDPTNYESLLNGPATQRLTQHLNQFPAEFHPGPLNKVIAGLAGASGAYFGGPMEGLKASQATLEAPEHERIARWYQENQPLQQAAEIESRRAGHILDPYRLMLASQKQAETGQYHQGMLQRPINVENLKEQERQNRIKSGSEAIDALPEVPTRIKSLMKGKLLGAGGGWSDEAGTFKQEQYIGPDKQLHVVMRNTKDPNLIYESGTGRELTLKDMQGWAPYERPQVFTTGEGTLGLVSPRAATTGAPGAITNTGQSMQTPVTTTPDIDPGTGRLRGVVQTERGGRSRYSPAPPEAGGVTRPLSAGEKTDRDVIMAADSDLKTVERLMNNPKVKEYIGLGGGAKAAMSKLFKKAPPELSEMQAAATHLLAMTAHPIIGSAMTAPELALVRSFTAQISNGQFAQDFFSNVKQTRRVLDLQMENRGLKQKGETGSKTAEDLRKQYIDTNAPNAQAPVDDYVKSKFKKFGIE